MHTLPHQFEFLSDAWLDEARAFLERETARSARSRSRSASGSRMHRRTSRSRTMSRLDRSWDGDALTVDRTVDDEADVVVEGDYQAALTAAQRVGITAPNAAEHLRREVARSSARTPCGREGRVPSGQVDQLLARLHDHLGRRTVENPDLRHRAVRQGLAGHVVEMEEQGFTVLERAISTEFADELREHTVRALSEQGVTSLNWMLYQGRPFELLAQHPQLMTLIDASLGRGAVIGSLSAIRKGPGPGTIPLHTDYSHVPEPYPEWAMTGVGVWALEDWTAAVRPDVDRARQPPPAARAPARRGARRRHPDRDAEGLGGVLHLGRVALAGRPHRTGRAGDAALALQPRHPAQPRAEEGRPTDAAPQRAAVGRDAGRGRLVRQDARHRPGSRTGRPHGAAPRLHHGAEGRPPRGVAPRHGGTRSAATR